MSGVTQRVVSVPGGRDVSFTVGLSYMRLGFINLVDYDKDYRDVPYMM